MGYSLLKKIEIKFWDDSNEYIGTLYKVHNFGLSISSNSIFERYTKYWIEKWVLLGRFREKRKFCENKKFRTTPS